MKANFICHPAGSRTIAWLTLLVLSLLVVACRDANANETKPYKLSFEFGANDIMVKWIGVQGDLQIAKTVTGPWMSIPGAESPFQVTPSEDMQYFRLQLPDVGERPHLIRGYIATTVRGGPLLPGVPNTNAHDVFLPCVEVYLRDASSGTPTISSITDLSGRFTLPAQEGRYRICWRAPGFVDDCSEFIVSVGRANVHVSTIRITPERMDSAVVYGKVRLSDGSVPRLFEPFANVNAFARVQLLNKEGNSFQEALVNNFGEYLLPQVPVDTPVTLRARMEGASKDQLLLPEANLGGAPSHAVDLAMGNAPPRLEPLTATDSAGRRIKVGRPGSTVRLAAHGSDPDGDAVSFKWMVNPGSGMLNATDTPQVGWSLPNAQGLYSVTLLAYDGKGGYAKSALSLRVDDLGIPFSGKVDATDGTDVVGARVEVNGQLAVTGQGGFFQIRVRNANRFVLNIRKPGYALVSQIYDDAVTGGRWTMASCSVATVDPAQPINVVDRRDERNCPGPLSDRLNWCQYPLLANPQWQDGSSRIVPPFGELRLPLPGCKSNQTHQVCGPGVRVEIPANALQDQNGQDPAGNVNIDLCTVDLFSPGQMPGDYTVQRPDGTTGVMQSYGAALIEITDGTRRFNLKPGILARVTIPVDPSQLAAGGPLPPTIPLLFYDETEGVWREEGIANLVGTDYVASVSHFSAINTDLVKTDQSCVRILSPDLPPCYQLEILIPQTGGAAPVRITKFIDNSPPHRHVVYNLPSDVNIVLIPIRIDNDTPIGTFVVNTGGPQFPTDPNLPLDPYDACATEVTFQDLAIPESPTSGEFLHGLFSFAAINLDELDPGVPADATLITQLDQATQNYYQNIDPRGKRLTLDDFKTVNGFGGAGEIHVVYANSVDLGFGRDMYGVKNGLDAAAYVTNYGDSESPDETDVADAILKTNPQATVAMEYSRIESLPGEPVEFDDPERVVKFYVYDTGTGNLLNAANLDGFGARPIPQLCMVCHGGEYPGGAVLGAAPPFNTRDDVKLGSKFIPFDLHSYTFSPATGFTKADQQADFKSFNQTIVLNSPPDSVMAEIITEMYPGGASDQDENFVVTGWDSEPIQQEMYRDVVGRSCRVCHAAQSFPSLQFNQGSQLINILGSTEVRVCLEHVMPHSKVTHKRFWTSVGPHQPGLLQIFGDAKGSGLNGWNGTLCGMFIPGGDTPAGAFDTMIQPIFNGMGTTPGYTPCIACHTGGSPPAGLSLAAGAAYDEIVDVASTQSTLDRVQSSDHNSSYLWHKINGTHLDPPANGSGDRMPAGGPPFLNATDINTLKDWINAGAAK